MKRTLQGRADLLRALSTAPNADSDLLAESCGFERNPGAQESLPKFGGRNAGVADDSNSVTLYEEYRPIKFWLATKCESKTVRSDALDTDDVPRSKNTLSPELQVPELPEMSLLGAGDWQNVWDALICEQWRSKRIDVPRSVQAISKSLPMDQLPRLPRTGVSGRAILLLDSPSSLRPLWHDYRQMIMSLQLNYGVNQLQVYELPYGPHGMWFDKNRQSRQPMTIDTSVSIYMAGAFGAIDSNVMDAQWTAFIDNLVTRGARVSLVSLVQRVDMNVSRFVLDEKPLCENEFLLSALSQVWQPTVTKLRRLRLAIPGASLADELWVYNHRDVKRVGRQLPLKPETLLMYNQKYRKYPESMRRAIADSISVWTKRYQGETAQEAERVQQQCHNLPKYNSATYPRLFALSQEVSDQIKGNTIGPECMFMRSMLSLTEALEPQVGNDTSWEPLMKASQQLAIHEGRALPWGSRGLESKGDIGYLKQVGDNLIVSDDSALAVLSERLGDQAYCSETRKIIDNEFEPKQQSFEIENAGSLYTLRAITKPAWADRFHRKSDGRLEAIHLEGTRFQRYPASIEHPQSHWQLASNLWPWASDAGIDEHGLWADLSNEHATYRLRWIPPGTFMMGSPDTERDRRKDEHLHEVTLSQGYWLGETTVTESFWESVMGEPKEKRNNEGNLPMTRISWDQCQTFISTLASRVESFNAQMPTESQWEYGCRAGTKTAFWWGEHWEEVYGNTKDNEVRVEGAYPANAFGLKSMHGNVMEWCQDYYDAYPVESVWDPQGPEIGQARVLRGGSWIGRPQNLRAASRFRLEPSFSSGFNGFRLAGGPDPHASRPRGASVTADRDEGTEDQRGGQARHERSGV